MGGKSSKGSKEPTIPEGGGAPVKVSTSTYERVTLSESTGAVTLHTSLKLKDDGVTVEHLDAEGKKNLFCIGQITESITPPHTTGKNEKKKNVTRHEITATVTAYFEAVEGSAEARRVTAPAPDPQTFQVGVVEPAGEMQQAIVAQAKEGFRIVATGIATSEQKVTLGKMSKMKIDAVYDLTFLKCDAVGVGNTVFIQDKITFKIFPPKVKFPDLLTRVNEFGAKGYRVSTVVVTAGSKLQEQLVQVVMQETHAKQPVKYVTEKFYQLSTSTINTSGSSSTATTIKLNGDGTDVVQAYADAGWTLRAAFNGPTDKRGGISRGIMTNYMPIHCIFEAPL